MLGSFFKQLNTYFIIVIIIIILISIIYIPVINQNIIEDIIISDSGFAWPIPGYTKITSDFGKRQSPTQGASSFHKGIDIGAPEGTTLIAVLDGEITYTGFLGGGGYTITLTVDNMKITYCHVSPMYIVNIGDKVLRGQVIGYVGPKNVYGVKGNAYKDENGNPTNGATTGTHLHLGIRVDEEYVNPLNYY